MAEEAERWPKIAAMYRRACRASYDSYFATRENVRWKSGDDMYEWWLNNQPADDKTDHLFPMTDN